MKINVSQPVSDDTTPIGEIDVHIPAARMPDNQRELATHVRFLIIKALQDAGFEVEA